MLGTKKITLSAHSVVDDIEIAKFGAVIEGDNCRFYHEHKDQEACKKHRDIVRADQAEFEDYAYIIQEQTK